MDVCWFVCENIYDIKTMKNILTIKYKAENYIFPDIYQKPFFL